jgi:hypothetical protein
MKSSIFRDVTPCSSVQVYRGFEGKYCLYFHASYSSVLDPIIPLWDTYQVCTVRSTYLAYSFTLTVRYSETSVNLYRPIQRRIIEDSIIQRNL